jgi:hypothetical protein
VFWQERWEPAPWWRSREPSVTYFAFGGGSGGWLTFADEALLDEAPEHVAAVVAVRGLVEGLLAEAVPVRGGRLFGRARHRRHVSEPPFTPDFHRELALGTGILQVYVISKPYANILRP